MHAEEKKRENAQSKNTERKDENISLKGVERRMTDLSKGENIS